MVLRLILIPTENSEEPRVVSDWDGHALTLSLLASYLFEYYAGNVAYVTKIPAPTVGEPRYERINRILHRYDEHLSNTERAFLIVFSAFRKTVHESAFESVFRIKLGTRTLNAFIAELDHVKFNAMVARLVRYRLIKGNIDSKSYTIHPLIRNYYYSRLIGSGFERSIHEIIMYYYLAISETLQYDSQ